MSLSPGDAEQIRQQQWREREEAKGQLFQQKLREREDVEWAKKLETWPDPCPVCFASPGQPCFTKSGKRAVRHAARAQ